MEEFEAFAAHFGKIHATSDEKKVRFAIFKANYHFIQADQLVFQLHSVGVLTKESGSKLDHGVLRATVVRAALPEFFCAAPPCLAVGRADGGEGDGLRPTSWPCSSIAAAC
mmetsp:Transcript_123623/g.395492  ORF Transcript_123623/g.395492 Transcript_123623/m.395492 type:complete len:111 (-) Transcript_123623:137-469(-)